MKKRLKTLLKGIMGGVCNSIGGWLFLRAKTDLNSIAFASFLFTTGSLFISHWFFYLFTGKIGFLLEKDEDLRISKAIDLVFGLLGNILGCIVMGFLIRFAAYDTNHLLFQDLQKIVDLKMNHDWYEALILAFFCGLLIHIGVDGLRRIDNPLGRYIVLFLCIGGFTLAGFEHAIANMFFFALNNTYTWQSFLSILIFIIGNSLGGLAVSGVRLLVSKE